MDHEILNGCIEGDRLSQKRLYERYYSKMMGVCLRYATNRDEAAEILNKGFFKVFKKIEQFRNQEGNLEGWIYRIMVNTAIDHYRREQKHKHYQEIDSVVHPTEPSDVISELSAEEILNLVQELTPGYRTVFSLYVLEGYNHREIGEKLGISEGTSKSNLAKARAKLQAMIEERFKINWRASHAQ